MRKDKPVSVRETVYVWSGGGIEQIHKDSVENPSQLAPEANPAPRPEDQRRFPRLDLKLPILYKVLGHNASRIPTHVRPYLLAQSTNISPIGLCFTLAEKFENGTVLALTIHVMEKKETFSAIGRVIWTQPADSTGHFLTGVEFVVVEEDKLKKDGHGRMRALMEEMDPKA